MTQEIKNKVKGRLFHHIYSSLQGSWRSSQPLLWGVGVEWENFGPGSRLISLSYLAFPLVKLSISEAFGGSRLSLSFGENELSWKLHYLPGLMWANFSHTTISALKPFGNAQWSVSCSSVSAWHSFSQLSPELSLCDNSRLGLVSLRQDGYTRDNLMKVLSRAFKSKLIFSHYCSIFTLTVKDCSIFFKGWIH